MTGKVYLVGAGPGAPDLLTLRAAEVLRRAEIVFYDALVHPDTLALAGHAECVAVGKRSGRHSTAQRFINKRLIDAAHKHAVVVRLKGGDPMLFGRAHEELEALRAAQIDFEVVPGVTAALAASAELAISLTRRGLARTVAFVTPRVGAGERPNDWARTAASADTAVIYMGAGEAEMITASLLQEGLPETTPVVIVENASLPDFRRFSLVLRDLPRAADLGLSGPSTIMLGAIYAATAAAASEATDLEAVRAEGERLAAFPS
jgi:uroporphyrin-III C-methyltransferase